MIFSYIFYRKSIKIVDIKKISIYLVFKIFYKKFEKVIYNVNVKKKMLL